MPIRQDDNQPNRRFGIVNIILIGVGALLLFSSLFPNQNMQIPRVPYSLFIDQVNDGEVKRAYITQEQIRYELNGAEEGAPSVLATTPIFDINSGLSDDTFSTSTHFGILERKLSFAVEES